MDTYQEIVSQKNNKVHKMSNQHKMSKRLLHVLAIWLLFSGFLRAGDVTIIDGKHYSEVFGEIRNYRIFLPSGYYENPDKHYPVIYFYHGWSQRYFGSINTIDSDEGNSNNGDNIANYVADHDVIVVRPDGYNRRPDETYYLRPYNIGPVETYRQFPLYFPEIVNYIDAHYRTIPDRDHRAISGLSMGGFMTFWIAGKYPDMVSAAGNFCGSTEFVVGPYDFPAEYRHLDMYGNYAGVNVRLNYGDQDFIRDYHDDMNRIWTRVMDNYEYKIYHAEHSTCGLGEMYDFILNTFKDPPAKPRVWNHIDVYPVFKVWDFTVSTDRHYPGFTVLENVDEHGFRSSVREFLPDGSLMPFVNMTVTTAPLYKPGSTYIVHDFDLTGDSASIREIVSDQSGRLKVKLDGALHEIGISIKGSGPDMSIASEEVGNMNWAVPGKNVSLNINLLNKGDDNAGNVKATLYALNDDVSIGNASVEYGNIVTGATVEPGHPFTFLVRNDTAEIAKFNLVISDDQGHKWEQSFVVHVFPRVSEFTDFVVADGKPFTVAAAGDDTVSLFLGKGNGDGIANPGESIVLLIRDQGVYHRAEVYSKDSYIDPDGTRIRMSDSWSSYDHVGASEKYSVPLISSGTPQNHVVEFFATYWLPDYPYHIIRQGIVRLPVSGSDHTSPVLRKAEITGDNTVHVWLYDGGTIERVKARLIAEDNPEKTIDVLLNDAGREGDRIAGDRMFSKTIDPEGFGLYRIEVEAVDSFGNMLRENCPGNFQIH